MYVLFIRHWIAISKSICQTVADTSCPCLFNVWSSSADISNHKVTLPKLNTFNCLLIWFDLIAFIKPSAIIQSKVEHIAQLYYFTLSNARWFYLVKVSHEWVKTIVLNGLIVCSVILCSGIRSTFVQCLNVSLSEWCSCLVIEKYWRGHCPRREGIWYKYFLYTMSVFWQSNRPFEHFLNVWATEIAQS
jgi:hypothetical protein